jgi:hypothetical protein
MKYRKELFDVIFPFQYGSAKVEKVLAIEKYISEHMDIPDFSDDIREAGCMDLDEKRIEQSKAKVLKKIKKQFLRSRLIIAVVSVFLTLSVLCVGWVYLNQKASPIELNHSNVNIEVENNSITAVINRTPYKSAKTKILTVDRGGERVNVMYFYVTSSLWQRYFLVDSTLQSNFTLIDDSVFSEFKDHIDQIYYFIGDYKTLGSLSKSKLESVTQDAILLWSKE